MYSYTIFYPACLHFTGRKECRGTLFPTIIRGMNDNFYPTQILHSGYIKSHQYLNSTHLFSLAVPVSHSKTPGPFRTLMMTWDWTARWAPIRIFTLFCSLDSASGFLVLIHVHIVSLSFLQPASSKVNLRAGLLKAKAAIPKDEPGRPYSFNAHTRHIHYKYN